MRRFANTYNMPAGALGKLQSNAFSLAGYDAKDKPTLYFNYFLNTEDYGGATGGSNVGGDGTNPFRDSARVFVSSNDGTTWELLATNNSQLSAGDVDQWQRSRRIACVPVPQHDAAREQQRSRAR